MTAENLRCRKCSGQLEPIIRGTQFCFNFCRVCKLTYNAQGVPEVSNKQLSSRFNPLSTARSIIGKTNSGVTPLARTALEVFLMEGLWDCYLNGLKDGVLLAYSQDVEKGEPLMHGEPNGPLYSPTGTPKQDK